MSDEIAELREEIKNLKRAMHYLCEMTQYAAMEGKIGQNMAQNISLPQLTGLDQMRADKFLTENFNEIKALIWKR